MIDTVGVMLLDAIIVNCIIALVIITGLEIRNLIKEKNQ